MFKKAVFVAGLAIGFVAGSAAGREPFEQIKAKVTGVANDPEVRRKVSEGAERAKATVEDKAPVVADRATDAAQAAKDKVAERTGGDGGGHHGDDDSLAASSDSPETKHL